MYEQAFALLITNRKEITRAYQQALVKASCQVQIAATGHQGQLALLFTQPDLVIMDYILPDMLAGVIVRQIRTEVFRTRLYVTARRLTFYRMRQRNRTVMTAQT